MAQGNPRIDLSRPIPIDTIIAEVERMRGGGAGGPGGGGSEEAISESSSNEPQLLVPDFRLSYSPPAVPGFGSTSGAPSVKVTDRDRAEAEERLRRYDRNRDGFLTPDELSQGRWSDDPMQFDRNRDGKLSVEELAVRQAERRRRQEAEGGGGQTAAAQQGSGGWGGGSSSGWSRGTDPTAQGGSRGSGGATASGNAQEPEDRFGGAKSYRISTSVPNSKDLPSFFTSSDLDGDGQVTLSEFTQSLTDESLAEFQKWDLNGDGIITVREALAVVRAGASSGSSGNAKSSTADGQSVQAKSTGSSKSSAAELAGKFTQTELDWAKGLIKRYDKNGDGVLTKDEWESMTVKPDGADLDGDGQITAEEYAAFRSAK